MYKITEYKFVNATEIEGGQYGMATYINERIKEGWQPYGPLTIVNMGDRVADVIQVMVKYQDPYPAPGITGNLG